MTLIIRISALILSLLVAAMPLTAKSAPDSEIEKLTAQIDVAPTDGLYVRRADRFRQLKLYDKAVSDLRTAIKLKPGINGPGYNAAIDWIVEESRASDLVHDHKLVSLDFGETGWPWNDEQRYPDEKAIARRVSFNKNQAAVWLKAAGVPLSPAKQALRLAVHFKDLGANKYELSLERRPVPERDWCAYGSEAGEPAVFSNEAQLKSAFLKLGGQFTKHWRYINDVPHSKFVADLMALRDLAPYCQLKEITLKVSSDDKRLADRLPTASQLKILSDQLRTAGLQASTERQGDSAKFPELSIELSYPARDLTEGVVEFTTRMVRQYDSIGRPHFSDDHWNSCHNDRQAIEKILSAEVNWCIGETLKARKLFN